MTTRDVFLNISPIDHRYWDEQLASYLSEDAFILYKLKVELALVKTFVSRGFFSRQIADEIADAVEQVTPGEVAEEESRIRHDIRALVNCIQRRVSEEARPAVHFAATSFDISDTANAARYRECVLKEIIPALEKLIDVIAALAWRDASTPQIGRTHGQHAVPITLGFWLAGYVSRLGQCTQAIRRTAENLVGKFSGAVGAYNGLYQFVNDPEQFERELLAVFGLKSADHSTQIVQPEHLTRLLFECTAAAGVMANLARDIRNLQRTEIGEVGEEFGANQVGSSTMPHKRNPISFENVESVWKIVLPRLMTAMLDQVSEHQRDLTNSASGRTAVETLAYVAAMVKRLTSALKKLCVDREALAHNLQLQGDAIIAEPLYLLLAHFGHPDAHEVSRQLAQRARDEGKSVLELAEADPALEPYLKYVIDRQKHFLKAPKAYVGIAGDKTRSIISYWARELNLTLP